MAGELSGAQASAGLVQAADAFGRAFWVPTAAMGLALALAFRLPSRRVVAGAA